MKDDPDEEEMGDGNLDDERERHWRMVFEDNASASSTLLSIRLDRKSVVSIECHSIDTTRSEERRVDRRLLSIRLDRKSVV